MKFFMNNDVVRLNHRQLMHCLDITSSGVQWCFVSDSACSMLNNSKIDCEEWGRVPKNGETAGSIVERVIKEKKKDLENTDRILSEIQGMSGMYLDELAAALNTNGVLWDDLTDGCRDAPGCPSDPDKGGSRYVEL